ncbi:SigB/SigF/SigG family RNA polymerase sigma factor [Streptomyces qinzhouensis]|uniref:SigB/SigF/SigG family RNA polymerase sigma factor n=1 Tax=Streptomyces qinzhouensis TaxID=2599401 RepID=A0A5B8JTJ4_9ACTN|nr:SigB/SigF/SigG family RNA polymerase sigma factor [Streptomyces qinzhouensis]QDY81243.1 SigB/SigF/SigG family RNA polymerase sigma factor [Streptomyces qinzhouensis]
MRDGERDGQPAAPPDIPEQQAHGLDGLHGFDGDGLGGRQAAAEQAGAATAAEPGARADHMTEHEHGNDQLQDRRADGHEDRPGPPHEAPDGAPNGAGGTPEQVPEQTPGQAPGQVPEQVPGQQRETPRGGPDRNGARVLFVELRKLPDGSPERAELRNRLVRMHLPLVEHLARRFRNRGEPLDDLTQVATIGLIKSVDRFDPERGVEFSTYATPTVVGEIKRHFRDKGWAVRVPRRLQELRLSLTTATAELSQLHGRSPTVHELAERLGISEEEVLEGLESANAYSTLSLDVPDTDDESPAVADTLGAEDEALEGVEYRESLKPLLEDLPPREKRILLLRFFGNMTQSQIAQEVGISQMHVSRLLARTLAQLREKLLVEE